MKTFSTKVFFFVCFFEVFLFFDKQSGGPRGLESGDLGPGLSWALDDAGRAPLTCGEINSNNNYYCIRGLDALKII